MVTYGSVFITRRIHKGDSAFALGYTDIGCALRIVTTVNGNNLCPGSLEIILQISDLGISLNSSVNIIGVKDHGLSGKGSLCPHRKDLIMGFGYSRVFRRISGIDR